MAARARRQAPAVEFARCARVDANSRLAHAMRFAPPSVLLALLLPAVHTQATPPEVLRQRFADKLASPFLRLAAWHTDLRAAEREAARDGKLILVHCTRSFVPCGTSIRCEREVLSAPEFANLAARVVLYSHVTAHLDATHDRFLFEVRGSGWPHHAVLDATGRVLATHESHRDKSVAELTQLVDRARHYLEVEAATEADVAAARRRRLEAGLAAGALDLAEARELFAGAGTMQAADAARLGTLLTDLEVADVLCRYDRFDESVHAAAGAEFAAMWRQGKRPSARNAARDFWGGILRWLEQQERPDLALYREGLDRLEELVGTARGYREFLDQRHRAYATLQEKSAAQARTPSPAPPKHDPSRAR